MPDVKIVEIRPGDLLDILFHGAVYDESNDSEQKAPVRLQPDRTLRTYGIQVGVGVDGQEHVWLVDTGGMQWVHQFENYQIVDPVALTNAEADLFDPAGVASELFEVEVNIININNAAAYEVLSSIGHAVGGGALAQAEMFMRDDTIPIRGATGWMGPYIIRGNDTIRGQAALNNALTAHFRVKRVDIGA